MLDFTLTTSIITSARLKASILSRCVISIKMDLFKSAAFAKRIRALMEEHHVPGLAIAITQDGGIASLAFGKASSEPDVPFTTDTLFDIASCSKSLTAASVALLVADEEGHPDVQYETPVSKLLLDDFVMPKDSYTEDVTVEDIFSHRTGMSGYVDDLRHR